MVRYLLEHPDLPLDIEPSTTMKKGDIPIASSKPYVDRTRVTLFGVDDAVQQDAIIAILRTGHADKNWKPLEVLFISRADRQNRRQLTIE